MKKLLFVILILALIAIVSGCFLFRTKSVENDYISAIIKDGTLEITSRNIYSGIELSIKKLIQEDTISTNSQFLRIVSYSSERTTIAITKAGNDINPGDLLLSIKGDFKSVQELEIESKIILLKGTSLPLAIPPLPDGISIIDAQLDSNSNGFFLIHGKALSDVCGSEMIVTYDTSKISIDTTQGNDGVEALNTYAPGMLIVQHEAGSLKISTAFSGAGKNIADEDIYRVYVNTFQEGIADLQIGGEVRDSNTQLIGVTFTGGIIEIGGPKLLGDFDESGKVDLVDFINFARNYGSAIGDGKYDELYDIAPAEDHYDEGWVGIYDKCEPDGKVDLLDFIIFARNYGKSKPAQFTLTVTTTPDIALDVKIDGTTYPSPKSMVVQGGSNRQISVVAYQEKDVSPWMTGIDSKYTFVNWNDGSAQNPRNVTIDSDKTYTANMDVEYRIDVYSFPALWEKGVFWAPREGSIWQFDFSGDLGPYNFSYWLVNGQNVGSARPLELTIDKPYQVTAVFIMQEPDYTLTVTTSPHTNLNISIEGTPYTSPKSVGLGSGISKQIAVTSPQSKDTSEYVVGDDTRYTFQQWNDLNTQNPRNITVYSDITYTAQMKLEYLVATSSDPAGTVIAGAGWYITGEIVNFSAPQKAGFNFSHWVVNGVNAGTANPLAVTIDTPKNVAARFMLVPMVGN